MFGFGKPKSNSRPFKVGDRVRVISKDSAYYLEETVITRICVDVRVNDLATGQVGTCPLVYETPLPTPPNKFNFSMAIPYGFLRDQLELIQDGDTDNAGSWEALKDIWTPNKQKVA